MVEREGAAIQEVERQDFELRKSSAEYLRGEISLEEYNQRVQNGPKLDLRAMAAEQQRQEMRAGVERIKEKVNSFVNSVLKRNP